MTLLLLVLFVVIVIIGLVTAAAYWVDRDAERHDVG